MTLTKFHMFNTNEVKVLENFDSQKQLKKKKLPQSYFSFYLKHRVLFYMCKQMAPKSQAPESSLPPMLNEFAVIKPYEILHTEYVATQSFKKHFNCTRGVA